MLRIKPHAPLLVRVPVNFFEFQPCGRTPQAGYLMRLLRHRRYYPPSSSIHRLGRGLPGYLILFAPHQSSKPPSPPVFFLISTHSTATLGIPLTSPALKPSSFMSSSAVKPRAFTHNLLSHLHSLYAQSFRTTLARLHSLYAQSFRTTLAPYVLPRLLAHSLPGLSYRVPSFFVLCDRSLQS